MKNGVMDTWEVERRGMRVYLVKPVCKSHEQRKKSGNSNEPIFICAKIFIYSFLNSDKVRGKEP